MCLSTLSFWAGEQNDGNGKTRIPLFIFCLARSSPMLYSANLADYFFSPSAQICCAHPQPRSRALLEKQLTEKNDEFQIGEPLAMNYTGWQFQDCHKNFFGVFAYHLLTNVSLWTPKLIYLYMRILLIFWPQKKKKKLWQSWRCHPAWFIASVSANQNSSNFAVSFPEVLGCGAAGAHNKFEQMAQKSESTRFA